MESAFRQDTRHHGILRSIYLRVMSRLSSVVQIWRVSGRRNELTESDNARLKESSLTIRVGLPEDWQRASEVFPSLSADFLADALRLGHIGFIAYINEEPVGYTWQTTSEMTHTPEYRLVVPDGYAYNFKNFTKPEHRGSGVAKALALFRSRFNLDNGPENYITLIYTHNFSSIRADIKEGNRNIGYAIILSVARWRWVFITNRPRRLGLRFVSQKRD